MKMWSGDFKEDDEYREKFMDLTKQMAFIMADFCVNALNAFSRVKGSPLNPVQIDQTIDFEIQSIIQQFQNPEMLNLVRKISSINFKSVDPFK